jgi:hypothetical protein
MEQAPDDLTGVIVTAVTAPTSSRWRLVSENSIRLPDNP